MYVDHMGACLIHTETSSKVSGPLKLELQVGGGEPSCGRWELKQGSLQEQVLLTPTSFQSLLFCI